MKYYIVISALIIVIETAILMYLIKRPLKKKKSLETEREGMIRQLDENIHTITKLEKKRKKLSDKAKTINNPKDAFIFLRSIRRK